MRELSIIEIEEIKNKARGEEDWEYYFLLEGTDTLEVVEQDGGGEGGGEYCYSILKLEDKYYKAVYSYYSHYGFDFDSLKWYEVSPKCKEVIVYE